MKVTRISPYDGKSYPAMVGNPVIEFVNSKPAQRVILNATGTVENGFTIFIPADGQNVQFDTNEVLGLQTGSCRLAN